ncbi:hypothetical protein [Methylomonas sp. ZR1]|uniref:hypothetical protein n=1 Tax=unclassified Methylomonas TaxID=2608980 RepID=UPI0014929797|nr:hypothetical protein [Methylomonas sp. ZR1]NOV31538.1 hypothetical protein [Methylomonas sp. ZR1]
MTSTQEDLQLTLDTLQPTRTRPTAGLNRLCISISDLHFTDNTVGNQSSEEIVWAEFFADIASTCKTQQVDELTLILDGDVVDMIRSAVWAKHGVYPWERDKPEFVLCLREIMAEIVSLHATNADGFFNHLKRLPDDLKNTRLEVITLLGNHDKEIFTDPVTLRMYYDECLGPKLANLSAEYRQWVGKMYFDDEQHFADRNSVPWLPFYWGDAELRVFITHGQWRDRENSLAFTPGNNLPGWSTGDGWRAKVWQQLHYAPFIEACFGDTVAAGALSTFIYRCKLKLNDQDPDQANVSRIKRILDELDLYRPTSAAIARILQETRDKKTGNELRDIIENELYETLCLWLSWDYTLSSSPAWRRLAFRVARVWLMVTGPLHMFRVQLHLVRGVLWLYDQVQTLLDLLGPSSVYREDGASFKNLQVFPTFQDLFLQQGFRLHGEGHTHIPLQTEADIKHTADGAPSRNFTYINFGTWRDQLVSKEKKGYRRRGVGRSLYVLNKVTGPQPGYRFFVNDNLSWSDNMDRL